MSGHHHGHGHDHGHDHQHSHAPASFGRAFAIGAALNVALVAGQVAYGFAANSMALLADAAHNFGDVLALLLAWGASVLGRRLPSARRTYGLGRTSILASLINAMVLLIGVGAIVVEAVHRFADPGPVAENTVMWVAAVAIVVNGLTAWLFSGGGDDINIRGAFLHMAADAGVSAGVLLAALAIKLTGLLWLDPLTSLLIALAITVSTVGLLRESVNLAVDGVPSRVAESDVAAYLQALPGVMEVHDLHIWGLSTTETALTAHLVCHGEADAQALLRLAAHDLAHRFAIGHATLQVEDAELAQACRLRSHEVV